MELDVEKTVREFIEKTVHMSLATSANNKPWVCEVHFAYDENLNIYWRSLASRRHSQEIAANPFVAGNVVAQHELGLAPHGIYFEGTAELITDPQEREKVFPFFQKRLGANEGILEEANREGGHQFYKATVENWYAFGKFNGEHSQKYTLVWNGNKNA